jgi:tetratricopeptide (TPR) repeat protein
MAKIEGAIETSQWDNARALIERELDREPDNHWLLARLSTTYYEQQQYGKAATIARKAEKIAPDCPLVLWDLAGALYMLDHYDNAIALYSRITECGIDNLSFGKHGEGKGRGRGLYADSLYREALCFHRIGSTEKAFSLIKKSLKARGPGCFSIYPISQVRADKALLRQATLRRKDASVRQKGRALVLR